MTDNKIWLQQAVDTLQDKSMVIAMEELAELQQAISKGIRGKLDYDNLAEEIADVEIVLSWIKYHFNVKENDVDSWLEYKKNRLEQRINDGTLK